MTTKWYARTCATDSDGEICDEHWAATLEHLRDLVECSEPNHWTVFKDGKYRETWTTAWHGPWENNFKKLYVMHYVGAEPSGPVIHLGTTQERNKWQQENWEYKARWERSWEAQDWDIWDDPLPYEIHPYLCECKECKEGLTKANYIQPSGYALPPR